MLLRIVEMRVKTIDVRSRPRITLRTIIMRWAFAAARLN